MSRDQWINEQVDKTLVPALMDFIRIPNQSPNFDPDWESNQSLFKACNFALAFLKAQQLANTRAEIFTYPGRTPLLVAVVDTPSPNSNILIYGHLDKQPPNTGWDDGLGPYIPVKKGDFLYGRGSSDDGYAFFAAVLILKAMQNDGSLKHRVVLFFETGEESGSPDIPYHFAFYKDTIGKPDMVCIFDSQIHDYERLYLTSSLRGILSFRLKVTTLKTSVHSGVFGGMVADPMRVIRGLLDGLEDPVTGALPEELTTFIPALRYQEMEDFLNEYEGKYVRKYPWKDKTEPMASTGWQLIKNRTWTPSLAVISMSGLPTPDQASNLIHDSITLGISIRLPPTVEPQKAQSVIQNYFSNAKPICNAKVELTNFHIAPGYNAPPLKQAYRDLFNEASQKYFSKKGLLSPEGCTIPIVNFFVKQFGEKPFYAVVGVAAPDSYDHGPNENLNVEYLKKFMCSYAYIFEKFSST